MRVVIYSRVSTDAQERGGTSLDTQERACVEFALRSGWHIIGTIRDTASGYSLDRPGIADSHRLWQQNAADIIVADAVDRLSRNQNQIGVLLRQSLIVGVTRAQTHACALTRPRVRIPPE